MVTYDTVHSIRYLISAQRERLYHTSHTSQHQLVKHSSYTVSHWGRQKACVQETVMAWHGRLLGVSTSQQALVHPSQSSGHTHSCLIICDFISLKYLFWHWKHSLVSVSVESLGVISVCMIFNFCTLPGCMITVSTASSLMVGGRAATWRW